MNWNSRQLNQELLCASPANSVDTWFVALTDRFRQTVIFKVSVDDCIMRLCFSLLALFSGHFCQLFSNWIIIGKCWYHTTKRLVSSNLGDRVPKSSLLMEMMALIDVQVSSSAASKLATCRFESFIRLTWHGAIEHREGNMQMTCNDRLDWWQSMAKAAKVLCRWLVYRFVQ